MKLKNVIFFGLVALISAGLGMLWHTHKLVGNAEDGAVATLLAQSFPDAKGELRPLSEWKGRPLIVNFWATWCAPCVEEMPELSELQEEIAQQQIQILGIGIDSARNIAEFVVKFQITYPIFVAGISGTELSRKLGNQVGGLPFTVLIDSDGTVRKTYLGRLKMDELRDDLKRL